MDLVAWPVFVGFMTLMLISGLVLSLVSGLASAFAHRKTNSLVLATLSGVLPLALMCFVGIGASYWPSAAPHTVISSKSYTAATLPPPPISAPKKFLADDPKNLDLLQAFGIEPAMIEVCRKEGCRVDFTAEGGFSSVEPLKTGDRQYALDPATGKWKLRE